jgi:predicted transcriptional regulator
VVCLQHTLQHLSRLSNAALTEDACARLASGQQPAPRAVQEAGEERLSEDQYQVLTAQSSELAARLRPLNLKGGRRRAPHDAAGGLQHTFMLTCLSCALWPPLTVQKPAGVMRFLRMP